MSLILASGSPRRRDLLQRLGLLFDVVPATVVERAPHRNEPATIYTMELARCKAEDVKKDHPYDLVLSADTSVVVNGEILGKPRDAQDAEGMLRLLRGRCHQVTTAVVLIGDRISTGTETTTVSMRRITDEEICSYVASGEPMDKAGAYAIQGHAADFVERIEGCYETVVGLPLCLVRSFLHREGIDLRGDERICTHVPAE